MRSRPDFLGSDACVAKRRPAHRWSGSPPASTDCQRTVLRLIAGRHRQPSRKPPESLRRVEHAGSSALAGPSSASGEIEEVRLPDLTAFQHDLQAVAIPIRRPGATQRRTGRQFGGDGERFDVQRARHFARTVAACDDDARRVRPVKESPHHVGKCRADAACRFSATVSGFDSSATPSLPAPKSSARYTRCTLELSWPTDNLGPCLPTLMATIRDGFTTPSRQVNASRCTSVLHRRPRPRAVRRGQAAAVLPSPEPAGAQMSGLPCTPVVARQHGHGIILSWAFIGRDSDPGGGLHQLSRVASAQLLAYQRLVVGDRLFAQIHA